MDSIGVTDKGKHLVALTRVEYKSLLELEDALAGFTNPLMDEYRERTRETEALSLSGRSSGDLSNAFVAIKTFTEAKFAANKLRGLVEDVCRVLLPLEPEAEGSPAEVIITEMTDHEKQVGFFKEKSGAPR